jgi:hypothetical protein
MSKYITIPFPKPKLAKNLYEPLDTVQNAVGIDLLTNSAVLRPFPNAITAITNPASAGATAINMMNSLRASDGKFYVVGSATISAATNLVLFTTTDIVASPTWTLAHNVAGAPSDAIAEFKDGIFYGYGTNLGRWGNISGSPSATVVSAGLTTGLNLLLNHVGLGFLYFVHNSGKTVGRYDGSTVELSKLTINAGERIVSMKEYGQYVLLGIRSTDSSSSSGNGKSRIVVWDGAALTTVDQSIINDMGLGSIQVLGSTVIAICTTMPSASSVVRLRIYQGSPGGLMQLVEWKDWYDAHGPIGLNDNACDISMDKIWFAPDWLSGTTDGGIFVYDPAQKSMYRSLLPAANTTDDSFSSFRMFGTNTLITYANQSGTKIMNGIGFAFTSQVGTFETNAFALNGGLIGKIAQITINHKAIPTSAGFTVYIKQFGNYPWGTTVPTPETYQTLFTPEGNASTSGMTQSTNNAMITEISGNELFKECRYAQIKVVFDEVIGITGGGSAEIAVPIIIKTV